MDLPCKSSYLCKDLKEPLSHVYCHCRDLCLKTGKWPRASVLQNVFMYMLSMCSYVVWVLEFICIYLFIFNGRGTDCSFHKVLMESVDDTEATLSRSTQTVRVSRGALYRLLQPPMAKLHQSCWPVNNNPWRSVIPLLGWNKYQIRHHTSAPFCPLSSPVFPPLLRVPSFFPFHSFLSLSYFVLLELPSMGR